MIKQAGANESNVVLDLIKSLRKQIDLIPDRALIKNDPFVENRNSSLKTDHMSLIADLQSKITQLKAKRLERSVEFE